MYDLIGFEREYMMRGDPGFSLMFRDRIEDILRFYESLQNEQGFVNAARVEPYGFFPDWSASAQTGPDGHGIPAYGQMLLSAAFSAVERLARAWGDEALEARCNQAWTRLNVSIRNAFWRPQAGLFANGLDRAGQPDESFTSFAQAFAVAYGVAQPVEFVTIFRFLNDETRRSAHYSLSQVVEMQAYVMAGRTESAVRRLKSAWLPMIHRGYSRFFEDIEPARDTNMQLAMYGRKYATSLCHAWAGAAPIIAISRGILGIEPLEPGYKLCKITPQKCGIVRVNGSVPTPRGVIEIGWNGTSGEVTIPEGVSALFPDGRIVEGAGTFRMT
jgi:hypothetical protein